APGVRPPPLEHHACVHHVRRRPPRERRRHHPRLPQRRFRTEPRRAALLSPSARARPTRKPAVAREPSLCGRRRLPALARDRVGRPYLPSSGGAFSACCCCTGFAAAPRGGAAASPHHRPTASWAASAPPQRPARALPAPPRLHFVAAIQRRHHRHGRRRPCGTRGTSRPPWRCWPLPRRRSYPPHRWCTASAAPLGASPVILPPPPPPPPV
ncbi:hypothetical protein EMIHUDRAFT_450946, partial [Emiliania huxleyi CCMP1516]